MASCGSSQQQVVPFTSAARIYSTRARAFHRYLAGGSPKPRASMRTRACAGISSIRRTLAECSSRFTRGTVSPESQRDHYEMLDAPRLRSRCVVRGSFGSVTVVRGESGVREERAG